MWLPARTRWWPASASFAAGRYIKNGSVKLGLSLFAAAGALIGSFLGTKAALYLDENTLKTVLLCALPLAAVFLTVKRISAPKMPEPRRSAPQAHNVLCVLLLVLASVVTTGWSVQAPAPS